MLLDRGIRLRVIIHNLRLGSCMHEIQVVRLVMVLLSFLKQNELLALGMLLLEMEQFRCVLGLPITLRTDKLLLLSIGLLST